MNDIVKKAYEIQKDEYEGYLPEVEIGEICELNDVWDGEGEAPEEDYAYKIADTEWINYIWEVLERKENILDTVIRILKIELI